MKKLLLLLTLFISVVAFSQEKTKYIINNRTGKFDAINSLTGSGIIIQDIPLDTSVTYVLTLHGDTLKYAETTTSTTSSNPYTYSEGIGTDTVAFASDDTVAMTNNKPYLSLTSGNYLINASVDLEYSNYINSSGADELQFFIIKRDGNPIDYVSVTRTLLTSATGLNGFCSHVEIVMRSLTLTSSDRLKVRISSSVSASGTIKIIGAKMIAIKI